MDRHYRIFISVSGIMLLSALTGNAEHATDNDLWNPSSVIDNAHAIVVVDSAIAGSFQSISATAPGNNNRLLGMARAYRVVNVLHGETKANATITVFQLVGTLHGFEDIGKGKFLLFLRQMTKEELAEINTATAQTRKLPRESWTLATPHNAQWMAACKLPDGDTKSPGRLLRQLIDKAKQRPVDSDVIGYVKRLIAIRHSVTAALARGDTPVAEPSEDPFVRNVARERARR
ncbi:MAG: hypothetical protein M3463_00170 [Verrucomicrobiota bacterium]|nr:hypothetical protein [Verrucomicrobiota bacterium]